MAKNTRRKFLKIASITMPAVLLQPTRIVNRQRKDSILKFGIASYSFRNYDLDQTIQMTLRLGIHNLALKSMHLPLDKEAVYIKKVKKKIQEAGIKLYGAGVIYMNNETEVENAFRYAREAELEVIIGVPRHELLNLTEKKVIETGIKVAIHNHGPGDDMYPSPESVYEKVKNRDPRLGLCMDIGHTQRIGLDPSIEAKKYFDRLLDVHLKDVDKSDAQGETLEIGRGVIDIPGFLKVLRDNNYEGIVSFEYEKDPDDILPGISESIGYANGVIDTISG